MRNTFKKTVVIFLVYASSSYLVKTPCHAQDVLVIQSGEEYDVRIISKKGKTINYILWDDQENVVKTIKKKFVKRHTMKYLTKERISFSFSFGGIPYGTSTSLKNYISENGFAGGSNGMFGGIHDPTAYRKVSWMLEFENLIKPPHGFAIEFAQANNGYIQDRPNVTSILPLFIIFSGLPKRIDYSNTQLSASYKYYSKSYKSNLQVGFLMNNARIWESGSNANASKYSKMRGGMLLGYAGSLVEKKVFFMRFQTQFRYVFPLKIASDNSFLSGEKVGLNHLFVGIQTGVKIATNK